MLYFVIELIVVLRNRLLCICFFLHEPEYYCGSYKNVLDTIEIEHSQLALPHSVSRTLQSTGANLLHLPKSNIVKGDRAFMIAGLKVWNSLPSNIRAITNLVDFKKKLKTFFYRRAFM